MVSKTASTVAILIISNVLSRSVPTDIFLLRLPFGVNNDFHAHLIEVILFVLIEDFEPRPLSLSGI